MNKFPTPYNRPYAHEEFPLASSLITTDGVDDVIDFGALNIDFEKSFAVTFVAARKQSGHAAVLSYSNEDGSLGFSVTLFSTGTTAVYVYGDSSQRTHNCLYKNTEGGLIHFSLFFQKSTNNLFTLVNGKYVGGPINVGTITDETSTLKVGTGGGIVNGNHSMCQVGALKVFSFGTDTLPSDYRDLAESLRKNPYLVPSEWAKYCIREYDLNENSYQKSSTPFHSSIQEIVDNLNSNTPDTAYFEVDATDFGTLRGWQDDGSGNIEWIGPVSSFTADAPISVSHNQFMFFRERRKILIEFDVLEAFDGPNGMMLVNSSGFQTFDAVTNIKDVGHYKYDLDVSFSSYPGYSLTGLTFQDPNHNSSAHNENNPGGKIGNIKITVYVDDKIPHIALDTSEQYNHINPNKQIQAINTSSIDVTPGQVAVNDYSVAVWLYKDSEHPTNDVRPISITNDVEMYSTGGNNFMLRVGGAGLYTFTVDVGEVCHIMITHAASGECKLYKNGVLQDTRTNGGPYPYPENGSMALGRRGPSSHVLLGGVLDFYFKDSVLDGTDALELYNSGVFKQAGFIRSDGIHVNVMDLTLGGTAPVTYEINETIMGEDGTGPGGWYPFNVARHGTLVGWSDEELFSDSIKNFYKGARDKNFKRGWQKEINDIGVDTVEEIYLGNSTVLSNTLSDGTCIYFDMTIDHYNAIGYYAHSVGLWTIFGGSNFIIKSDLGNQTGRMRWDMSTSKKAEFFPPGRHKVLIYLAGMNNVNNKVFLNGNDITSEFTISDVGSGAIQINLGDGFTIGGQNKNSLYGYLPSYNELRFYNQLLTDQEIQKIFIDEDYLVDAKLYERMAWGNINPESKTLISDKQGWEFQTKQRVLVSNSLTETNYGVVKPAFSRKDGLSDDSKGLFFNDQRQSLQTAKQEVTPTDEDGVMHIIAMKHFPNSNTLNNLLVVGDTASTGFLVRFSGNSLDIYKYVGGFEKIYSNAALYDLTAQDLGYLTIWTKDGELPEISWNGVNYPSDDTPVALTGCDYTTLGVNGAMRLKQESNAVDTSFVVFFWGITKGKVSADHLKQIWNNSKVTQPKKEWGYKWELVVKLSRLIDDKIEDVSFLLNEDTTQKSDLILQDFTSNNLDPDHPQYCIHPIEAYQTKPFDQDTLVDDEGFLISDESGNFLVP